VGEVEKVTADANTIQFVQSSSDGLPEGLMAQRSLALGSAGGLILSALQRAFEFADKG
jgi:hypothetical protein